MRDDHHDFQTPKKEHLPASSNRKAKTLNAQSKKLHHPQQSSRRSLSSAFTPITEEEVELNLSSESIKKISPISESVEADQPTVEINKRSLESDHTLVSDKALAVQLPEESVGISPVSEAFVFEEDQSSESIESYIMSLNQFTSPSSVTTGSLEVTPLSSTLAAELNPLSSILTVEMTPLASTMTAEKAEVLVASVTCDGAGTEQTNSFKLEPLVKHLRKSMFQVLHSADIDPQYKKLLDALIKVVIEEFCSLHEEREMVVELFPRNVTTLQLIFLLCILAVSAGFIFFPDVQSSHRGPPPT